MSFGTFFGGALACWATMFFIGLATFAATYEGTAAQKADNGVKTILTLSVLHLALVHYVASIGCGSDDIGAYQACTRAALENWVGYVTVVQIVAFGAVLMAMSHAIHRTVEAFKTHSPSPVIACLRRLSWIS